MKKLLSAVLALTLLGTAGASAQSWRGNGGNHVTQSRGYQGGYRDSRGGYRHDDHVGAEIGLGLGLFALGAILASQSQPHYAPPAYDNGYYDNGYYNNGYYNNGYYGR